MRDLEPAKPVKVPRISAKIREAIDELVAGNVRTVTAAAEKVGISREHLSRELGRPHILEHFRRKVQRNLVVASARAGDTKIQLLDSPNEMVRDRASSFILGLIGVTPQSEHATAAPGEPSAPGLQIVIVQPAAPAAQPSPMIDVTPSDA